MKPQLTRTRKLPSLVSKGAGGQLSLAFHDELVATIHGAFEVAVDIAVLEVTKLVAQAMGDLQHQMQRENESLKQRLQKADKKLDSARSCMRDRGGSVPAKQLLNAISHTDQPNPQDCHTVGKPKQDCIHSCMGERGGSPPLKHADQRPSDPQDNHASRSTGESVKREHVHDAALDLEEEQSHGYFSEICENGQIHSKEIPSRALRNPTVYGALHSEPTEEVSDLCIAKVESSHQLCQGDPAAQHSNLPPLPGEADKTTPEQIAVKEERPAEVGDCCFDSMGAEEFGPDNLSLVQSQMLEEWKPELLDVQNQEADTLLPCTSLALAHSPNMTTSIPPGSDLPPLSSEFPSVFQPAEPASIPAAPPQVNGVHVRTGRHLSHHSSTSLNACKICGQMFQQPSLLRRHYGQCQQRLQQGCRQPVQGTKRTKLQLYPPGCSPFRCTECNREFNRLENLKTHLRIHTGERPYTCSVCSKCFRHSGALTRHFRIHTGEKPYVCGQCGKSFRNCGGLKFHQRSHSRQ